MNKKIVIPLVLVIVVVLVVILFGGQKAAAPQSEGTAALPSSATSSLPSSTPAPTPNQGGVPLNASVTIQNFAFSPADLTVAPGTQVTWSNKDAMAHTVTADDGSFHSGAVSASDVFSFTFTKAGIYHYHCSIHPSMKGTITVK